MKFEEYSEQALRTCHTKGVDKVEEGAIGLVGEASEVLELVKKWRFQGHELDIEKVQKELGDVMWYFAEITNELGLNFETILLKNLKKLKERYPEGFDSERSINRKED